MSMGKVTEPCMEEVGLWRRMLTRAQHGNLTNHNFFHIRVVEGYLQSSMFCILGLPRVFMEHYRPRLKERITLEGADGHQWLTMLGLQFDSQQYCLNIGWREFAQDHDLALNDQLVFLLFEDSHFLVQVFDSENNFKGRVKGKEKAAATSLAEKTKDVPIPRGNSFLFGDPDRTLKEVLIQLPDSDEEDEDEEHIKAPEEHIKAASGIKMRPKQTVSRPCNIKAARIVAEDLQKPTAPPEKQNVGSRSPPASISAPSSPEPAPVLKRPRKLRGYDEDEDYVGHVDKPAAAAAVPADCEPPFTRPRRDAALSKANKLAEMMAAEATTKKPRSSSKKAQESPPKGMKRQPVSARPKVKVQKKKRAKATPTPPPSPPPPSPSPPPPPPPPQPEEAPKVAFKRPAKTARLGPQIIYTSKRRPVTDQERKETLEKAQEYARSCKNRHYVMQLRVPHVYCGYHLGVLSAFVEALELPLRKETMTFYDVTGKTWEVDWQGDHPQRPGFNSKGWTKFVLDHCLEEGDVCVFELPDPKEFNISVTIFPIVPLGVIPELGWKAHYSVPRSPGHGFPVPRSPADSQHKFAVPRSPAARSPLNDTPSPVNNIPPPSPVNNIPPPSPVNDIPPPSPVNNIPPPSPVNNIPPPSPVNDIPSGAPSATEAQNGSVAASPPLQSQS